ncbi:MAG: dihydroorotase [Peptostreptococcus sp.]|uniref:dihydroorotase n=1 Tax=Peptostreptococcus sp. TaxID=1262 RepID=UPI001CB3E322|nr:dihydroorotase [Peptostreptococcus sp.]MBF1049960.1 dihydroorotase [Peptostreptococcus sp.]MBF1063533.1 dihydroorotase [Peptostreptococcus sp.]
MNKVLIKNGKLINPATNFEGIVDISIQDGLIKEISPSISSDYFEYDDIIDANGMIVSPGLIDIHSHFRDPGFTQKEDLVSGAHAAAAGGYTTVILMANTNPKIDSIESLAYIQEKAKDCPINILQEAALTIDFKDRLVDMDLLHKAGAAGFTNDGVPVMNTKTLRDAMLKAAQLDTVIALHEEDNSLIDNHGINAGPIADKLGLKGAPRVSEDIMVARDCMLALETGACIDIQHISSGNAVDFIRYAKSIGVKVFAEATPHHFTLTEDNVLEYGVLAKMNPPLRSAEDRERIIAGLIDDTIEIIATDHAPHTADEKNVDFTKAPSGIIGLETALPLAVTELVMKNRLSMIHMLSKFTSNPARYYKLNKGNLQVGKPADVCIFDPNQEYIVEGFKSKSSNSPFLGRSLYGKVKYTIVGGDIVYKG